MSEALSINIFFLGSRSISSSIRRWIQDNRSHACAGLNINEKRCTSLDEAVEAIRSSTDRGLLMAIDADVDEDAISGALEHGNGRYEAIILNSAESDQRYPMPSASLMGTRSLSVTRDDLLLAVRKALIRLRYKGDVDIRPIKGERDFEDYLRLRYEEWARLNYIPEGRQAFQSQMEADHLDQGAIHLGVYDNGSRLVGCARLVDAFGTSIPETQRMVNNVVEHQNDSVLNKSIEFPTGLQQPFDVLEPFAGFRAYYRNLKRNRVRVAEASRIIVHPEFRNYGLGEAIVDSLVVTAYRRHVNVLILACLHKHRAFYEKSGFRKIPGEGMECERFPRMDVPAIVMDRWFKTPDPDGRNPLPTLEEVNR